MLPPADPHDSHHEHSSGPISKQVFIIAGILTTVYGLDELSSDVQEVACLWLLHPRLQTQECMQPIASRAISHWNGQRRSTKGLVAVSFDQRNHGSRLVDAAANEAWRSGNPRHAQDMFSIYRTSDRFKLVESC